MHADHYGTRTDTGRARDINEDTFLVSADSETPCQLFPVADGVGGELYGTQASQRGVHTARDTFYATLDASAGHPPDVETLSTALKEAFQHANEAVYAEAQARHVAKHMATTLVALALTDAAACVGWVGDSRVYHLPEGKGLKQVTRDHSFINLQIERGLISEKDAVTHPGRNVLSRSIGGRPEVDVDTLPLELAQGDMILLCSDGLTRHVTDREIEHLLRFSQDADSAADQLVDLANQRGGRDNITVIVLDFGKLPTSESAFETETLDKRPEGLDTVLLAPTPPKRPSSPRPTDHHARFLLLLLIAVAVLLAVLVILSTR